jgi:hypothetical protein
MSGIGKPERPERVELRHWAYTRRQAFHVEQRSMLGRVQLRIAYLTIRLCAEDYVPLKETVLAID